MLPSVRNAILCLLLMVTVTSRAEFCSSPPKIPNASSNITEPSEAATFDVGTIILYACDFGYFKKSGSTIVECVSQNGSAIWSTSLVCQAVSCSNPAEIKNGQRIGNQFTFPNNITYVCNDGYEMQNHRGVIFCQTDGTWSGPPPRCNIISCPSPPTISNGRLEYSAITYKSMVTYSCDKGYKIEGSQTRHCLSNKTWSGREPTCLKITCPQPRDPPGGRVIITSGNNTGALIIYRCSDDSPPVSARCLESGVWSEPPPVCKVVPSSTSSTVTPFASTPSTVPEKVTTTESPGVFCGDPGNITHGYSHGSTFAPRTNLTFACLPGYELRGKAVITCLPTGKWNLDKLPICVKPIPVSVIIGIALGALFLVVLLGFATWFLYKKWWKRRRNKRNKANILDAHDLEETKYLGNKKPIPVTTL